MYMARLLLALSGHFLHGEDVIADRHAFLRRRLEAQNVRQIGQGLTVTLRLSTHAKANEEHRTVAQRKAKHGRATQRSVKQSTAEQRKRSAVQSK